LNTREAAWHYEEIYLAGSTEFDQVHSTALKWKKNKDFLRFVGFLSLLLPDPLPSLSLPLIAEDGPGDLSMKQ